MFFKKIFLDLGEKFYDVAPRRYSLPGVSLAGEAVTRTTAGDVTHFLSSSPNYVCVNCNTEKTTLWRRDISVRFI